MVGYFDDKGNPRIKITIAGRKLVSEVEAFFDTGCSGYLVLPISMAVQLGLELIGIQPIQYADGRISNELVFKVLVKIDDKTKAVPATLTASSQALAGIGLFSEHSIKIDFKNKKVEILKISEQLS